MSVPEQLARQQDEVDQFFQSVASSQGQDEGEGSTQTEEAGSNNAAANGSGESIEDIKAQLAVSEQRYRTLQGMFDSTNAEHQRTLAELQAEIEALKTKREAGEQSAPPVQKVDDLIRPQDVEEFGADQVDFVKRVVEGATSTLAERNAELERKLSELQGAVVPQVAELATSQQQTREQSFWAQLSALVPDWQAVNSNPQFQEWLLGKEPLMAGTRNDLLAEAQQKLDAQQVANFFVTWKEQSGYGKDKQASVGLDQHVAPGTGASAQVPSSGQNLTMDQVVAATEGIYTARMNGEITQEEYEARERALFNELKRLKSAG